jgi:hypothetical protein
MKPGHAHVTSFDAPAALRDKLAHALALRQHNFRYPSVQHPSCCTCGTATLAYGYHLADVVIEALDLQEVTAWVGKA